jgi:DNA-directed RNA polymerase II subunit RPB1
MQRIQPSFVPSNTSPIVGFQLGIPSAEETVQQSVVEVASLLNGPRVTAPQALNWLFDPKMGVTKPGAYCPTDGNTYIDCPGYFGYLWLARPVYYTQYLKYTVKVLGLVCWKCSQSLMDEARHRARVMRLPRQRRFELVTGPAIYKCKRCPACHAAQPKAWKQNKESAGEVFAVWKPPSAKASAAAQLDEVNSRPARWDPLMVFRVLDGIADDTIDFLGMHPQFSRPSSMICRALPIAPPAMRPSVDHESGQRAEDDISTIYVNIIKYNAQLAARMEAGASELEIGKYLTLLQCAVTAIFSNKFPGATITQNGGRPLQSISDRLDGKNGRTRHNLNGKRANHTARSVISGNPTIGAANLGVPLEMCMYMTVPEVVTDRNRAHLQQLVLNGPDVWPGARSVVHRADFSAGGGGGGGMPVTVSLRHAVRESIVLRAGDVVHRQLQENDVVGFNRQPSLHKSSFMGHRLRMMPTGQSFRLNLAATQTYNADFDGDEMNLHVPQTTAAQNELQCLALVTEQMIDASKTAPNLAFFQDSMLGLYLFSGEGLDFSLPEAMELLCANSELDLRRLLFGDAAADYEDEEGEQQQQQQQQQGEGEEEGEAATTSRKRKRSAAAAAADGPLLRVRRVGSREVLGQTLPAITMSAKNKAGAELRLENGRWLEGQADKTAMATGSKGVLHRICNDFGKQRCVRFIDDVQNLVTTWIAHFNSFSVGTGDLDVSPAVHDRMEEAFGAAVREMDALQTRFRLGLAENSAAWSNAAEFERQAWNVLSAARTKLEAAGGPGLAPGNRFLHMVHSGSKGNVGNVTQMAMGLCQQAVSGARAPYGFADRTLPMFAKFDDGAAARGFITRSYARGLQPADMFIHAVAGREGLIDTAIKTSGTGYIARKLRTALEIATVQYGFTVRDHSQRVVQFRYGDDGFNSEACEVQPLPLVTMDLGELAMRYDLPVFGGQQHGSLAALFAPQARARLAAQEQDTRRRCREDMEYLVGARDAIVRHVFRGRPGAAPAVSMPVNFAAIVAEVRGQQQLEHRLLDLTPLEAMDMVRELDDKLVRVQCGFRNPLFSACLHFWLNPRELLLEFRFHRAALALLLGLIELRFKQALQAPGEPVGVLAAQCIAEPATQMTLNTFHSTGLVTAKGNVTHGVPRLEELIGLTENTKKPALTLPLLPADRHSRERAVEIAHQIESLTLHDLVAQAAVVYDPVDAATRVPEDADWLREFGAFQQQFLEQQQQAGAAASSAAGASSGAAVPMSAWVIRLVLDARAMLNKDVTMDDVHFAVAGYFDGEGAQLAYTDFNASQLVLRVRTQALVASGRANQAAGLDTSEHLNYLIRALDALRHNMVLRGVAGIRTVTPRKVTDQVFREDGAWVRRDAWVLDTEGSNLAGVLALEDLIDVDGVHCNDVREVHAVLGVQAARSTLLTEVVEVLGEIKVDYHHTALLADRATMTANMVAANHAGLAYDDTGPLAKMSFERHSRMSVEAAVHGEFDNMRGVTASVMCGQHGHFGTGACRVLLDVEAYARHTVDTTEEETTKKGGDLDDLEDDAAVDARLAVLEAQSARCRHVAIENNLAGSRAPDAVAAGCMDDGYLVF